jgi:hypothetical protein
MMSDKSDKRSASVELEELREIFARAEFHFNLEADHTFYYEKETRAALRGRAMMAEAFRLMAEMGELNTAKAKELFSGERGRKS